MDQDKLKKICHRILHKKNFSIVNLEVVRTNRLNEVGVWEESSYCVFLTVIDKDQENYYREGIVKMLESIFGFEFIVEFS